ncbi:MAG: hypothetical protein AAGA29_03615 [Planctomycetota bacterium]
MESINTAKPTKAQQSAVKRMLKAKPGMSDAERACAVLLAHGIGCEVIAGLASRTPAQLRDLAASVASRVATNEGRIRRERQAQTTAQRKADALGRQRSHPGVLAKIGALQ